MTYTEFGDDAVPNVQLVGHAEARSVTCKRCLRIIGPLQLHFNLLLPKPLVVIAEGQTLPLREAIRRLMAGSLGPAQWDIDCENGVRHENVRVEMKVGSIRLSTNAGTTILTADPENSHPSW